MASRLFDIVVVGGGLVGTSIARELLNKYQYLRLALVEKESSLGKHQSGHNSGVIHSGIYYTPGSLKAKLCTEGLDLTYDYCNIKGIPYKKCGKLIVAVKDTELENLNLLYKRGCENKVKDLRLIGANEIKEIEPNCKGIAAIWSPNTGIVDWALVNQYYGRDCIDKGAEIFYNFLVNDFKIGNSEYPVTVCSNNSVLKCKYVVTCGGLYSDKLAMLSGCSSEPKIIPVRGDYLQIKDNKSQLVQTNIYSVPDIRLPFLDVHFTPRMDGKIWIGPNAILALKKEGYSLTDFNVKDAIDILSYKGVFKLASKYWSFGVTQLYERLNQKYLVSRLQQYVPSLRQEDVMWGPCGVRAQALNRNGELIDDFCFDSGSGLLGQRIVHIRNAPSPAATSSLAIAKYVTEKLEEKFHLKALQRS